MDNDGGVGPARLRSLEVPYLSTKAPMLETPQAFRPELQLYPHQRRALHRMVSIERDGDFLKNAFSSKNIGTHLDYEVKGGVLADLVGMGKTATVLALLCSEPRSCELGPNLLLAPSHLLEQWASEAKKFCKMGEVEVITGLAAFHDAMKTRPLTLDNRSLVVVDAHSVVKSRRYYYQFRKLYQKWNTVTLRGKKNRRVDGSFRTKVECAGEVLVRDLLLLETYKKKAVWISPGFQGVFYGVGGPKEQALFFPSLVLGGERQGFRRVLFDEIQDLVEEGLEEKDCLLQLTKETQHLWLITATPFPARSQSVYANHQLLGFRRLRLVCESVDPLPADSPFEIIKRKLYIRSPVHVRNEAVNVSHEVKMVQFVMSDLEQVMYKVLLRKATMQYLDDEEQEGRGLGFVGGGEVDEFWSEHWLAVRTALTCFAASESIRHEMREVKKVGGGMITKTPTANELAFHNGNTGLRGLFRKLLTRRRGDIEVMADEIRLLKETQIPMLNDALVFAKGYKALCDQDNSTNVPQSMDSQLRSALQFASGLPFNTDKHKRGYEWVSDKEHMLRYAKRIVQSKDTLFEYVRTVERMLGHRQAKLERLEANLPNMIAEVKTADALITAPAQLNVVPRNGSKIENMLKLLDSVPIDQQIVLFCYELDVMHIIAGVLKRRCKSLGITNDDAERECDKDEEKEGREQEGKKRKKFQAYTAVTLSGSACKKAEAIRMFTTHKARIMLACLRESASGTNLQNAEHVVFMDIPGLSDTQAAALVTQAMGRVIRMGQDKRVTVHYLIANNTHEVKLAEGLLYALGTKENNSERAEYTCEERAEKISAPLVKTDTFTYQGIEVMQQSTLEGRLTAALNKAIQEGKVVEIDDDDDDGSVQAGRNKQSNQPIVLPTNVPLSVQTNNVVSMISDDEASRHEVSETPVRLNVKYEPDSIDKISTVARPFQSAITIPTAVAVSIEAEVLNKAVTTVNFAKRIKLEEDL